MTKNIKIVVSIAFFITLMLSFSLGMMTGNSRSGKARLELLNKIQMRNTVIEELIKDTRKYKLERDIRSDIIDSLSNSKAGTFDSISNSLITYDYLDSAARSEIENEALEFLKTHN